MSARRLAQFVPIGIPTTFWKTFSRKSIENVCLPVTRASRLCHPQSICFWSQSVPSQNMLLRDPIPDIVSAVTVFENEGVLNNTRKSALQLTVKKSCVTGRKIERLDAQFYG